MVVLMIIYLEDYPVFIPGCGTFCIFGQYPLALTILLCWLISYIITFLGWEPDNSPIRYDRNETQKIMEQSHWMAFSYPGILKMKIILCSGMIGIPSLNIGLGLAFIASVMVDVVENLGSYDLLSRVCDQKRPPKDAVNRAIVVEGREVKSGFNILFLGVGSMLGASMGVGMGLTTYSNNIAIIQITKVSLMLSL